MNKIIPTGVMTRYIPAFIILIGVLLQGCAGVNTFPTVARAGSTVSLLVGGTEDARKDTVSVILTDDLGGVWDLQALGSVRSLFSIRPDGLSEGLYYSSDFTTGIQWAFGHEPIQSVVILDLPAGLPPGPASLSINTNVTDNSGGVALPFTQDIEILAGVGASDSFLYRDIFTGETATDLTRLEPLPNAKLTFGVSPFSEIVAAAEVVIDFNELNVNPDDIAVFSPKTTHRADVTSFDDRQHMLYWRQDGDKIYINMISPNGIETLYLHAYIMHPRDSAGTPDFTIVSTKTYDINGNETVVSSQLDYTP